MNLFQRAAHAIRGVLARTPKTPDDVIETARRELQQAVAMGARIADRVTFGQIPALSRYSRYGQWADEDVRADHYAEYLGKPRGIWTADERDDFSYWYRVLREQEVLQELGRADLRPQGRYAQALEILGYRASGSTFQGRRVAALAQEPPLAA